jgi:urea transport system permease protein
LNKLVISAAVLVVLGLFPTAFGEYQSQLMAKFLVFGLLALSLDLIWGYTGVINFSQATFFGLGAYGAALVLKHVTLPGATYLAILAAICLPVVLAVIMGYLLFYGKVGGVYFAIVTVAVGSIIYSLSIVWIDFTGGLNGLYGFPDLKLGVPGLFELPLGKVDVMNYYYVILVATVLIYLFARRVIQSPFGRALQAVKANESRAEFVGYDVAALKLMALALSAGIAGLSGVLYLPVGVVSPEILGILFSTNVLVWVAVGGRGTLIGPLVGALVVGYLQTFLSDVLVSVWLLIIGVFFVFVVLFWPDGVVGFVKQKIYPALYQRMPRSTRPSADSVKPHVPVESRPRKVG